MCGSEFGSASSGGGGGGNSGEAFIHVGEVFHSFSNHHATDDDDVVVPFLFPSILVTGGMGIEV